MVFTSITAFTIRSMVAISSIDAFDHGIFPSGISFGSETLTLLESFYTLRFNGHYVYCYIMF